MSPASRPRPLSAGLGFDTGVDADTVWRASDLVDEFIGDEPVTPTPPRVATLAAQHRFPPGLVAALDLHLRANAAGDRIVEVLDELARIRAEIGSPPLAAPIGQILASQALVHVLSAERYQTIVDELKALVAGRFGTPPAAIDPTVQRAVELVGGDVPAESLVGFERASQLADGLAASEEELCLLALFGEDAASSCARSASAASATTRTRKRATRPARSASRRSSASSRNRVSRR